MTGELNWNQVVEKYGDGHEVVAKVPSHLPGKILGIARLYLAFRGRESRKTVIEGTLHEAAHVLADPGEGTIGIQSHPVTAEFEMITYESTGRLRTPAERLRISRAPLKLGLSMGENDKEIEHQALIEIIAKTN